MVEFFSGEYRFLSNFWLVDVVYDGDTYRSTEHAFQAAKTLNLGARLKIADAATPAEAKRLGKSVELRSDWEHIKLDVMYQVLCEKFKHPELREKLLGTGSEQLVEGNTWMDRFWGVCGGRGENHLGKLLMRVREEVRNGTR